MIGGGFHWFLFDSPRSFKMPLCFHHISDTCGAAVFLGAGVAHQRRRVCTVLSRVFCGEGGSWTSVPVFVRQFFLKIQASTSTTRPGQMYSFCHTQAPNNSYCCAKDFVHTLECKIKRLDSLLYHQITTRRATRNKK